MLAWNAAMYASEVIEAMLGNKVLRRWVVGAAERERWGELCVAGTCTQLVAHLVGDLECGRSGGGR